MKNPFRALGRGVRWPFKKVGGAIVEGAIDQAKKSFPPPAPPEKGAPMLGYNKRTNLIGILILVGEVLKIVIPMLQGGSPGIDHTTPTNLGAAALAFASRDGNRG